MKLNSIFSLNHPSPIGNAIPIPYPTATANPPNKSVSIPDFNLFKPTSTAFANPKLKSSTPPIIKETSKNWVSLSLLIPALMT